MQAFAKSCLLVLALSIAAPAWAADWTVDPSHSHVGFTISHMVSKVRGEFQQFSGEFSFDPAAPDAAKGNFVVKTASISTNDKKRDDHLRSPEFFDVKKYPEMTLTNVKLAAAGDKKYTLTGDLSLHGVTKPVSFDAEFGGTTKDPWGNTRSGFTATGKINREDFGIVWNKALETGGLLLGKEVTINLEVEAIEGKPAEASKEKKKLDKAQTQKSGTKSGNK